MVTKTVSFTLQNRQFYFPGDYLLCQGASSGIEGKESLSLPSIVFTPLSISPLSGAETPKGEETYATDIWLGMGDSATDFCAKISVDYHIRVLLYYWQLNFKKVIRIKHLDLFSLKLILRL